MLFRSYETRQRLNRAADERAQRQKVDFIAALLPVMDNLQRAIEAAEKGSPREAVLEGLKGTQANFEAALAAAGAGFAGGLLRAGAGIGAVPRTLAVRRAHRFIESLAGVDDGDGAQYDRAASVFRHRSARREIRV